MDLKPNDVKRRLRAGEVCIGTMLRILTSPKAVPLCASEGWDYVILDTEHNDYDPQTLGLFSLLAKYERMALFVRIPDSVPHVMAQTLDYGAEGLVIPQVGSAAQARDIVRSTKYAPLGRRGVSQSATATRFRTHPVEDYVRWANSELLNIVQIESMEGVRQVEEIVAVEGIDAVMMGPADLTMDMGIPGRFEDPGFAEACRKVIRACDTHGVAPGIHVPDMAMAERWLSEGMRFLTYSYDSKLFKEASRDALRALRQASDTGRA